MADSVLCSVDVSSLDEGGLHIYTDVRWMYIRALHSHSQATKYIKVYKALVFLLLLFPLPSNERVLCSDVLDVINSAGYPLPMAVTCSYLSVYMRVCVWCFGWLMFPNANVPWRVSLDCRRGLYG